MKAIIKGLQAAAKPQAARPGPRFARISRMDAFRTARLQAQLRADLAQQKARNLKIAARNARLG